MYSAAIALSHTYDIVCPCSQCFAQRMEEMKTHTRMRNFRCCYELCHLGKIKKYNNERKLNYRNCFVVCVSFWDLRMEKRNEND